MYRYFVSFAHVTGGQVNLGTIEVRFPRPIRSVADVDGIGERLVRNEGLNNVTILSFSLFTDDANGATS